MPGEAVEWYVSASKGNDSAAGTESAPFVTISRALDAVGDGDEVWLFPGNYSGRGNVNLVRMTNILISGLTPHANETLIDCANAGMVKK
jgi:hypothetical protein